MRFTLLFYLFISLSGNISTTQGFRFNVPILNRKLTKESFENFFNKSTFSLKYTIKKIIARVIIGTRVVFVLYSILILVAYTTNSFDLITAFVILIELPVGIAYSLLVRIEFFLFKREEETNNSWTAKLFSWASVLFYELSILSLYYYYYASIRYGSIVNFKRKFKYYLSIFTPYISYLIRISVVFFAIAALLDILEYNRRYKKGLEILRDELTHTNLLILKKVEIPKEVKEIIEWEGEINQTTIEDSEFKEEKICLSCIITAADYSEKKCIGLQRKNNKYSFCCPCYKRNIITKHLDNLTKEASHCNIPIYMGESNNPFRWSTDCKISLENLQNKKAYLTAKDLNKLRVSKEIINNYINITKNILQLKEKNYCLLCKEKKHLTKNCPKKESILDRKAKLYAWHTGKTFYLPYLIKRFILLIWHGPLNDMNFLLNDFLRTTRPCPHCGFVTDKDNECTHIFACPSCGIKWDWEDGKKTRIHTFSTPLSIKRYTLTEYIASSLRNGKIPMIPFNQKGTLGDPFIWSSGHPGKILKILSE